MSLNFIPDQILEDYLNLVVILTMTNSLNLTSTKLFSTPIKSIRTLFSGLQNLTHLSVKNNTLNERKVSVFKEILLICPSLRYLNIIRTEISSLPFTSILNLFEHFQNLEGLQWNDFNFSKLTETEIISLFSQLKNLKSINFSGNNTSDFPLNTWEIILPQMQKLQTIDVNSVAISEKTIKYFQSNFSGILIY